MEQTRAQKTTLELVENKGDSLAALENGSSPYGVSCMDFPPLNDFFWFSILAHRDYVHRIHDWISCYPNPCGLYSSTPCDDGDSHQDDSMGLRHLAHPIHDVDHYRRYHVLREKDHSKDNNKPEENVAYIASAIPKRRQGKRQSCELYVVLVTFTSVQILESIPAMGKRGIRRIDRLISCDGGLGPLEFKSIQQASSKLLGKLQQHGETKSTIQLRTDIFPKTKQTTWMSDIWMDHLLNHQQSETDSNRAILIKGCPSASKADLVSILIRLDDGDQMSGGRFICGLSLGREFLFLSQMLNEHATRQLPVALEEKERKKIEENLSCRSDLLNTNKNGSPSVIEKGSTENAKPENVPSHALPQSRAFYKMKEILETILCPSSKSSFFGKGWLKDIQSFSFQDECSSGLDLGASPGGWTQALRGGGGLRAPVCGAVVPRVISVDAGALSQSVLNLGNVTHIKALFPSQTVIDAMVQAAPFSFICCDSNRDYSKTIEDLKVMFAGARQLLQKNHETKCHLNTNGNKKTVSKRQKTTNEDEKNSTKDENDKHLLAPTCIFVLTVKFCHKRTKAIQSVLDELITPNIRSDLQAIAGFDVPFQMFHLMANSVSERTIVANIGKGGNKCFS